jgi:hypothetical protein
MMFLFICVLSHPLELFGLRKHEPFHHPKLLVKSQNLLKILAQQLGPPKGVLGSASLGATSYIEHVN